MPSAGKVYQIQTYILSKCCVVDPDWLYELFFMFITGIFVSWILIGCMRQLLRTSKRRNQGPNVSMLIVINSVLSKFSFVLSYYSIPGMCNEKTVKYQVNRMIVSFSAQIIYHIGCTLTMNCLIISKC